MTFKEFTEAELIELESDVFHGRAFASSTVDRLIKAVRLWNERAHQTLSDGVKLAGGLSDSAMLLEDAGVKLKAERDALLLQISEQKKALDALTLDLGSVVDERDALKKFIEGVREKAEGLLHSEVYKRALGLTTEEPHHGKGMEVK